MFSGYRPRSPHAGFYLWDVTALSLLLFPDHFQDYALYEARVDGWSTRSELLSAAESERRGLSQLQAPGLPHLSEANWSGVIATPRILVCLRSLPR